MQLLESMFQKMRESANLKELKDRLRYLEKMFTKAGFKITEEVLGVKAFNSGKQDIF